MTTHYKHSPHHPRPQGADLTKKDFKVEDLTGKVWASGLTWDEAWKEKERVAGARLSTTPMVLKIGESKPTQTPTVAVAPVHVTPTWSLAEAATAAATAASAAAQAAEAQQAVISNVVPINALELTAAEQALIDDIINSDAASDDDMDDAIEAEAASATTP